MSTTTIPVPADAVSVTRDMLARELLDHAQVVVEELGRHFGGSGVALADGLDAAQRLAHLTPMLVAVEASKDPSAADVLTDRERWLIRGDLPTTASAFGDLPEYIKDGQRAEVVHYAGQLAAMIATLDAIGWTSHDVRGPVTDDVREFADEQCVVLRNVIDVDHEGGPNDEETVVAFARLAQLGIEPDGAEGAD